MHIIHIKKAQYAAMQIFLFAAALFIMGCGKEALPPEQSKPGLTGQPAEADITEQPQSTQPADPTRTEHFPSPVPTETAVSGEAPAQSDFEIDGDVLLRYSGKEAEVTVPEDVKRIGSRAFAGNSSLVRVILPEDVETVEDQAFSGCSSLKEINMQHVKKIASAAFYECRMLEKIDLAAAEILGSNVFYGSGVREVTGLEELVQLGDNIFDKTPLLYHYDAICGSDMLIIQHILFAGYRCRGDIVIPEGVEIIASRAFQGAEELISVICSDTVREIRDRAFENCSALEKFWMSDSVVSVGENILSGDSMLCDLRLSGQLVSMPFLDFMDADSLESITLPERCAVPPRLFEYDYDYGTYDRGPKRITVAPNKKIYTFLKDPCRKNDYIYSTEPFSDEWLAGSKRYGWSLNQLALDSEELVLAPGAQYQLAFNSGAKADWTSDDETVVRVDRDGGLTAAGTGTALVTATIYGKEYHCRIVVESAEGINSGLPGTPSSLTAEAYARSWTAAGLK